MRGISEEAVRKVFSRYYEERTVLGDIEQMILDECQELSPWMTLDEFLKSGFEGLCWLCDHNKNVVTAYHDKDAGFYESTTSNVRFYVPAIYKVMPIHKPEPPK